MRARILLSLTALMLGAAGIVAWIVLDTQAEQQRIQEQRRSRRRALFRAPGLPIVPDPATASRYSAIGGPPRLIANLADRVGPFVVSVRQISDTNAARTLWDVLPPSPAAAMPLGRLELVLQVNAVEQDVAPPVFDASTIQLIDETGKVVTCESSSADFVVQHTLADGWAYRTFVTLPSESARLIRRIQGALYHDTSTGHRQWQYRIDNVPLPNHDRVFGEMTVFDPAQVLQPNHPHHLTVLTGPDVEVARAASLATDETDTLPHLRLILPEGVPAFIRSVLPPRTTPLSLSVTDTSSGHLDVSGSLGMRTFRVRVWEREPFVVLLPAADSRKHIGVLLSLNRSNAPLFLPAAAPLFPGTARSGAGSVALRIHVRGRPVGPALVPVAVQRWENSAWTEPRTTSAPIRASGYLLIGNLRAGRYRIRLHMDRLTPVGLQQPLTEKQYLQLRYGVGAGSWAPVEQVIDVVPGQRAYGKPVAFVEHNDAPSQSRDGTERSGH